MIKDFLVSLAEILVILAFVAKNSKNFLGFLSTILKNLANFCEPCQDLGKKSKNARIFSGRKPRFFLVLLPRSWMFLVFLSRSPKVSWISFHDLEKSCKILRTLRRIIAKILAKNFKNPNFLARKPRSQALGTLQIN